MTRDELIAALEKAEGPSRELDDAIWHYLVETWPEGMPCPQNFSSLKAYTSSIDAALTLAPFGEDYWSVESRPFETAPHFEASCWNGIGHTIAYGATPALALCIAALKARGDKHG